AFGRCDTPRVDWGKCTGRTAIERSAARCAPATSADSGRGHPRSMSTENAHDDVNAAPRRGELAIALTGGGARAAYQVGLLVWLSRRFPDLEVPILTGVSAGAGNAGHLAAHPGNFRAAVSDLARLWSDLTPEDVFRVDTRSLAGHVARWATRLTVGGFTRTPTVRGLVDTTPLRNLLEDVLAASENGEIVGIAD